MGTGLAGFSVPLQGNFFREERESHPWASAVSATFMYLTLLATVHQLCGTGLILFYEWKALEWREFNSLARGNTCGYKMKPRVNHLTLRTEIFTLYHIQFLHVFPGPVVYCHGQIRLEALSVSWSHIELILILVNCHCDFLISYSHRPQLSDFDIFVPSIYWFPVENFCMNLGPDPAWINVPRLNHPKWLAPKSRVNHTAWEMPEKGTNLRDQLKQWMMTY